MIRQQCLSAFEPTGLGFMTTRALDFGKKDFVREEVLRGSPVATVAAELSRTGLALDAASQAAAKYVGGVVVDPASGCPIVYGDFGVRMNG